MPLAHHECRSKSHAEFNIVPPFVEPSLVLARARSPCQLKMLNRSTQLGLGPVLLQALSSQSWLN